LHQEGDDVTKIIAGVGVQDIVTDGEAVDHGIALSRAAKNVLYSAWFPTSVLSR
jgi:hypothetical protein